MNLFKRENFITEPAYSYEAMIVMFILALAAVISVVIGLPVTIPAGILTLELIIYGVQSYRIRSLEAQKRQKRIRLCASDDVGQSYSQREWRKQT